MTGLMPEMVTEAYVYQPKQFAAIIPIPGSCHHFVIKDFDSDKMELKVWQNIIELYHK